MKRYKLNRVFHENSNSFGVWIPIITVYGIPVKIDNSTIKEIDIFVNNLIKINNKK